MPFNRTIILADDLTGANDTAIQFANQGLSALVITHGDFSTALDVDAYDVVAVNSNSRGMDAGAAYHTVRDMVRRLEAKRRGCFFYKKIDSVLRGNPGKELAAVMDELEIPLALAAPSFPANRSVMEHGLLSSGFNGTGGSGPVDAVRVFALGSNRPVKNIPLEEIRRGHPAVIEYIENHNTGESQIFAADAVTDEDLEIIFRAYIDIDKPVILAGSAALANHISRDMRKKDFCKPLRPMPGLFLNQDGSILVVAGTRQGETAAQIATLSRIMSVPIIRFKVDMAAMGRTGDAIMYAYNEAAAQMRKESRLFIIAVESMFKAEIPLGDVDRKKAEKNELAEAISSALGILTRKLLDSFRFSVIISTGGDTSLGICRHLEIKGIEPLAEICPGIPIGKIADGAYKGKFLITKSGRFGDKKALLEIMDYLGLTKKDGMKKGIAL
jgi:uncharacterized protein YgbK (DUF1537 family)